MTIRHIPYQAIDFQQWDLAIERTGSGLPYAYSWYLDKVANRRWAALVYGDYELVMPLPWNAKLLGYKQIYQPLLCQQLGLFGKPAPSCALISTFLSAIPKQYRFVQFPIHLDQKELDTAQELGRLRLNLKLSLGRSYDEIAQAYSKSLRKRLRKANTNLQIANSRDVNLLIQYYRRELNEKIGLKDTNYQLLKHLFVELMNRDAAFIKEVKGPSGALLAIGLFINVSGRIINVFGASNAQGRQYFAMHFLLDQIIKEHAEKAKELDFEGSEIPGVGEFFKSFGAKPEYYLEYKKDELPTWLRLLRNRKLSL